MTKLTPAELTVLQHAAEGRGERETAEALHVSISTVKVHRAHAIMKLGAKSTTNAVAIAIRAGLL